MSHLLENDRSMVYCGERPWHGLGTYIGDQPNANLDTVVEALPTAGSNIVHRPAMVNLNDGSVAPVPGQFVSMRELDQKILGIVGDQARQSGMSPRRALQAFENMFGEGRGSVHTAGFLRDGKVFWVAGKAGSPIVVESKGRKDEVEKYFLLTTAFDGSLSTHMLLSPVRPVCNNTVTLAMKCASETTKIKHTRNHESKLLNAEEQWAEVLAQYDQYARRIQIYAATDVPDATAQAIFAKAFGLKDEMSKRGETKAKNKLELVNDLYNGGRGNAEWTGTAWGVFNALTEYSDHYQIVRGTRDSNGQLKDPSNGDKILDSVLFGAAATFKANAMQVIDEALSL